MYRHLEWLKSLGGPPILVRTAGKLGDDLLQGRNSTGQRFVTIPAFTTSGSSRGQLRRQCTKEYKINVIERAIRRDVLGLKPRQRVPKDVIVHQYYGISIDEARRAKRIIARIEKVHWQQAHFPLLDLQWTRGKCKEYLKVFVPHEVPRSACVFCPFRSDEEWQYLKQHDPAGFARAVEIDSGLRSGVVYHRNQHAEMYLHTSRQPLVEIDFSTAQPPMICPFTTGECEGMCGV